MGTQSPSHSYDQAATREAPNAATLRHFNQTLDRLVRDAATPEARINALLDLFATRCATARESRTVGEALFAALNSTRPRPAVVGRFHERFVFHRAGDNVAFGAEGQHLADLPLDDAIRLATLLHGASDTTLGRLHAA